MKKIILVLTLGLFSFLTSAQDGTEHKITNILLDNEISLNTGRQFRIQVGDVFQVFGESQIIHPATGKLVTRDNVYIGKVIVIEVNEHSSIAKILEKKADFTVGNKVIKVVSEEQQIVETKRPVQTEFENPKNRNYSETIYTQSKKKAKNSKDVNIIKIAENNDVLSAIINKGAKTKAKGGKPKIGSKYYIFVPNVDTSKITGKKDIYGEEYIGNLELTSIDHDASTGILRLNQLVDFNFVEENNIIKTYMPINSKFGFNLSLKVASFILESSLHRIYFYEDEYFSYPDEYDFNTYYWISDLYDSPQDASELRNEPVSYELFLFPGVNVSGTYYISNNFNLSLGSVIDRSYHQPYIDGAINNFIAYGNLGINFAKGPNSPFLTLGGGKIFVTNGIHDIRPYNISGQYYLTGGLGSKISLTSKSFLSILIAYEGRKYNLPYYPFYDRMFQHSISFSLSYSFIHLK